MPKINYIGKMGHDSIGDIFSFLDTASFCSFVIATGNVMRVRDCLNAVRNTYGSFVDLPLDRLPSVTSIKGLFHLHAAGGWCPRLNPSSLCLPILQTIEVSCTLNFFKRFGELSINIPNLRVCGLYIHCGSWESILAYQSQSDEESSDSVRSTVPDSFCGQLSFHCPILESIDGMNTWPEYDRSSFFRVSKWPSLTRLDLGLFLSEGLCGTAPIDLPSLSGYIIGMKEKCLDQNWPLLPVDSQGCIMNEEEFGESEATDCINGLTKCRFPLLHTMDIFLDTQEDLSNFLIAWTIFEGVNRGKAVNYESVAPFLQRLNIELIDKSNKFETDVQESISEAWKVLYTAGFLSETENYQPLFPTLSRLELKCRMPCPRFLEMMVGNVSMDANTGAHGSNSTNHTIGYGKEEAGLELLVSPEYEDSFFSEFLSLYEPVFGRDTGKTCGPLLTSLILHPYEIQPRSADKLLLQQLTNVERQGIYDSWKNQTRSALNDDARVHHVHPIYGESPCIFHECHERNTDMDQIHGHDDDLSPLVGDPSSSLVYSNLLKALHDGKLRNLVSLALPIDVLHALQHAYKNYPSTYDKSKDFQLEEQSEDEVEDEGKDENKQQRQRHLMRQAFGSEQTPHLKTLKLYFHRDQFGEKEDEEDLGQPSESVQRSINGLQCLLSSINFDRKTHTGVKENIENRYILPALHTILVDSPILTLDRTAKVTIGDFGFLKGSTTNNFLGQIGLKVLWSEEGHEKGTTRL